MFIYINTLWLTTLIIYSSKTLSICNFTHHLCSQNTSNFSSYCQQVSTRREGKFWNQLCNIMAKPNNSVHPISLKKKQTVYWSRLNIGVVSLQESFVHRKIRERLLERAVVVRYPVLSNRCKFWLANQQAVKYISATESEINKCLPFPLGDIVWHISTKVNDIHIAA